MGKKVALGEAACGKALQATPQSLEERVEILQNQVEELMRLYNNIERDKIKSERSESHGRFEQMPLPLFGENLNKDGIPVGTTLTGQSPNGIVYVLKTHEDMYSVGVHRFPSLTMAATDLCGNHTDGWSFWRTLDGIRAGEAYHKIG